MGKPSVANSTGTKCVSITYLSLVTLWAFRASERHPRLAWPNQERLP
jgi:hypothetical protein